MNPGTNIKTLTIDGKEFSAREDQTILDVARENRISIPTLCHLAASRRRRLPALPGRSQGHQQAAARLRDARRGGHGGHDQLRAPGPLPARRSWSCCSPSATTSARSAWPTATANCRPWRSVCRSPRALPLSLPEAAGRRARTSASSSTTTAASCARAACASATRSKARTPGT